MQSFTNRKNAPKLLAAALIAWAQCATADTWVWTATSDGGLTGGGFESGAAWSLGTPPPFCTGFVFCARPLADVLIPALAPSAPVPSVVHFGGTGSGPFDRITQVQSFISRAPFELRGGGLSIENQFLFPDATSSFLQTGGTLWLPPSFVPISGTSAYFNKAELHGGTLRTATGAGSVATIAGPQIHVTGPYTLDGANVDLAMVPTRPLSHVYQRDNGTLSLTNASTLRIGELSTLTLANDLPIQVDATSTLVNDGTLVRGPHGTTSPQGSASITGRFDNLGMVHVVSGTLQLLGDGMHTGGVFYVEPNATLEIAGGNHRLEVAAIPREYSPPPGFESPHWGLEGKLTLSARQPTPNVTYSEIGKLVVSSPELAFRSTTALDMRGGTLHFDVPAGDAPLVSIRSLGAGHGVRRSTSAFPELGIADEFLFVVDNGRLDTGGTELHVQSLTAGTGRFHVSGLLIVEADTSIQGATLTGTGRTQLADACVGCIREAGTFALERHTLDNFASLTVAGNLYFSHGATLNNHGLIDFTASHAGSIDFATLLEGSDTGTFLNVPGFSAGTLNNHGTLAFHEFYTLRGITLNNHGTISARRFGQPLILEDVSGVHSGTFVAVTPDSGYFIIVGGHHRFTSPVASGIISKHLSHSGGILEGGILSMDSAFFGGGGLQKGEGQTFIGPLFSTIDDYRIEGRAIVNGGTLQITGPLTMANGATLTNFRTLEILPGGRIAYGGAREGDGPTRLSNNSILTVLPDVDTSVTVEFINQRGGLLEVADNARIEFARDPFENQGLVTVASGATIVLSGIDYLQTDGTTDLAPGSRIRKGSPSDTNVVRLEGGILMGEGAVEMDVLELGGSDVRPGHSPGILTIDGNFIQMPGASIEIEIESLAVHDVLKVTGNASFAGILKVVFLQGFVPAAGDRIEFLDVDGDATFQFSDVQYFGLPAGIVIQGGFQSGQFVVTSAAAVPEPHVYVSMLAGLLLLGTIARASRKSVPNR